MTRLFKVSSSPHIHDKTDVPVIMYSVVVSLIPALAGAVYFFGLKALLIIVLSVVTCMTTEGIIEILSKKTLTIRDGSTVITGILLAFNLPGGIPWWIPVIGSVFAIAVGKMTFGGIGQNPMNPALLGRVFLLISWPVQMTTTWTLPAGFSGSDAVSTATPLTIIKEVAQILKNRSAYSIEDVNLAVSKISELSDSNMDLFIGNVSGSIGETSVLLLLIGAAFLMYKHYIGWRIPFTFIGTVALFAWIFGGYEGLFTGMWLFHVLSGGLILGTFFMATDMVTSPVTPWGQVIFGIGCGVLTAIIRLWGGYPEGVSFAILLMNLLVPLLDSYFRPAVFGKVKKHA